MRESHGVTGKMRGAIAGRVVLALLVVSAAVPPAVEAQTIEWTRQLGTPTDDVARAVSVGASGVYVVGLTDGELLDQPSAGGRDAFVVKFPAATPAELIQKLIADLVALDLTREISDSLDAKLGAALRAIDDMRDGNDATALGALNAFINSVAARRGARAS
jgi:hypothetical protein